MKRNVVWAVAALLVFSAAKAVAAPLVDADWLAGRLNNSDLVVLDIRYGADAGSPDAFEAGHIPGAVHADYATAGWRMNKEGVPGMLPPVADLEKLIGGLGIGNGTQVVVVPRGVSASDYGSATRVYWTFKVLGHDAVSILDGGYKGWLADASRPVETGAVTPEPAAFKADFRRDLLATGDDVKAALDGGATLIDNRPAEQYQGKAKHPKAARAGTIPGAVNIPQGQFFDAETGRFAGVDKLAQLWEGQNVAKDADQIEFCNTGHWASLGWFASHELLGNSKARMYDGSMTEWAADDSLPIVNGQ